MSLEDAKWPHPDVTLGCNVPAQCEREAEARILRALRCMFCMPRPGRPGRPGRALDLPPEAMDVIRRYDHEQSECADDVARLCWRTTRRDEGDLLYALGWYTKLNAEDQQLVRYRASLPEGLTFREIGDRVKCSDEIARRRYNRAIERLFKIAKRKIAPATIRAIGANPRICDSG